MSKLFEACPNEVDGRLNERVLSNEEAVTEEAKYSTLTRKQWKIIKKVRKLLKKQNKMLKQEIKRQDTEKEKEKKGDSRRDVGFLREFGKAICKAVPAVLTTLATMAFNSIFIGKRRDGKSGLRFA